MSSQQKKHSRAKKSPPSLAGTEPTVKTKLTNDTGEKLRRKPDLNSQPESTSKKSSFWKDCDRFWFGYNTPTALGLFRIFAAGVNLLNLCLLLFDFGTWYTEQGLVPIAANNMGNGIITPYFNLFNHEFHLPFIVPRISLLANCTNAWITLAFFLLTTIACLLTMFGLWTRVSSIIAAIGVVSLDHRNMLILHGGDTVMRLSILYVAIAPSGSACSLDRLIGLWKGRITGPPPLVSVWPQRLIQFNLALIYFTTWWLKMDGNKWRNGTAVYYTARLHEFYRFWVPPFLKSSFMMRPLTYGTLVTELSLGTIVFYKPARKWVLLAGLLMHGYIEYSMNIPFFALAITSMYICFYDGNEIDQWATRVGMRLKRWGVSICKPVSLAWQPGPLTALQAADCNRNNMKSHEQLHPDGHFSGRVSSSLMTYLRGSF